VSSLARPRLPAADVRLGFREEVSSVMDVNRRLVVIVASEQKRSGGGND
jgi:hypothetical protein